MHAHVEELCDTLQDRSGPGAVPSWPGAEAPRRLAHRGLAHRHGALRRRGVARDEG